MLKVLKSFDVRKFVLKSLKLRMCLNVWVSMSAFSRSETFN